MIRIYFDTNIFSNLESDSFATFHELNRLLLLYKHNLSFFFSPAHIRDKRKADDRKLDYFRFMETIVSDNHISYHAIKKNTTHYLATPLMVYEDDSPDSDMLALFGFDDDNISNALKETLIHTPLPFDINQLKEVPEDFKELYTKMFPLDIPEPNMFDFLKSQLSFSSEMTDKSSVYSETRKFIAQHNSILQLDEVNEDFNKAFESSYFKKNFIDYVKTSLHHTDKSQITFYELYNHSYTLLDMFGIMKDKLKSKNGFGNILNDGLHSYYASYCDYLVTEDKGLREKSKALYSLYNIPTTIVSPNEFIELLPSIGADTENDIQHFISKLAKDFNEGMRSQPKTAIDGTISCEIDISKRYFNFFDGMECFTLLSGETYIILGKKESSDISPANFRETEKLVNKLVAFWGQDIIGLGLFMFDNEVEQIRNNEWTGRLWSVDSDLFYLHKNIGHERLCLQIGPIKSST